MAFRAASVVAVVALPSTAMADRPDDPTFVVSEVTVKVAGMAKIGSVRSGMLCAPNGGLLWHQIAMPAEKAIGEAVAVKLRSAGRTIVTGNPRHLSLSIDGAAIKICTAWMGMGNAPKGKGSLTLTWRELDAPIGADRPVTVSQDLAFDHRDPRVDPSVILDAITVAAVDYAASHEQAK